MKCVRMALAVICWLVVCGGSIRAADKPDVSVQQAIAFVSSIQDGCGNMRMGDYQVRNRLWCCDYRYRPQDKQAWQECLSNEKNSVYTRLCAASFLLTEDENARSYIQQQLASSHLLHRYNAVAILLNHGGDDARRTWCARQLIALIEQRALDPIPEESTVGKLLVEELPEGTYLYSSCDLQSPLNDVCHCLGQWRIREAAAAILSVLERFPEIDGAASAAGQLNERRAIPYLMASLKKTNDPRNILYALGELKAREAVPLLLEILQAKASAKESITAEETIGALLTIADDRALPALQAVVDGSYPERTKMAARLALLQLNPADPTPTLLSLLDQPLPASERSDIIRASTRSDMIRVCGKYPKPAIIARIQEIAATSPSAFFRREAIGALRQMNTAQSLMALASLLEATYPKDLTTELGWKFPPNDFSAYFLDEITRALKESTKQDFGTDRQKWQAWIQKHLPNSQPAQTQKSPTAPTAAASGN